MEIIFFKINRQTSAFHKKFKSEKIYVSEYANEKEAEKIAKFKALQLVKAGFQVNITKKDIDNNWSFLQTFKNKGLAGIYHIK